MRTKFCKLLIAMVLIVLLSTNAYTDSGEDLAKAAQNPIANMISLPLQYNLPVSDQGMRRRAYSISSRYGPYH